MFEMINELFADTVVICNHEKLFKVFLSNMDKNYRISSDAVIVKTYAEDFKYHT